MGDRLKKGQEACWLGGLEAWRLGEENKNHAPHGDGYD